MSGGRIRTALVSGLAAIGVTLVALGQNTDEPSFIQDAIRANLAEVQLGELALQRGADEQVRKFGEALRQDHTAALKRATNIAKSLKIEAPAEPAADAKRKYDGLAQLSGSQFDAAFVSHMVIAHEAEIAKYSANANSDDDAVAAYIADSLPKLKQHLAMAQAIQKGAPLHSAR